VEFELEESYGANDLDSPAHGREKAEADGMDYICEHMFQALTQSGKLTKAKGWNPLQNASAKDGTTYRALFCDSCGKNYNTVM